MAIKINLEEIYIPVDFGEVELKFNPSEENLMRLTKVLSGDNTSLSEIKQRLDAINEVEENATEEHLISVLKLAEDTARELLDGVLGDGSFAKIYERYPSVSVVLDGFMQLAEQLPSEVGAYADRIRKSQERKIAKYKRGK